MLTLQYAKNPVYADAAGNAINLIVKLEELLEEMPFTATSYDVEKHGQDWYCQAQAGDFGPVSPYVEPTVTTTQTVSSGTQTL